MADLKTWAHEIVDGTALEHEGLGSVQPCNKQRCPACRAEQDIYNALTAAYAVGEHRGRQSANA